jgi:hypothetical protein
MEHTDAGALVRSPTGRLHAMEALAQQGQLLRRNADARVRHREFGFRLACRLICNRGKRT